MVGIPRSTFRTFEEHMPRDGQAIYGAYEKYHMVCRYKNGKFWTMGREPIEVNKPIAWKPHDGEE